MTETLAFEFCVLLVGFGVGLLLVVVRARFGVDAVVSACRSRFRGMVAADRCVRV